MNMSPTVQVHSNGEISLRCLFPKLSTKSMKTDLSLAQRAKAALGMIVFALQNLIRNLYTTAAAQPAAAASQNRSWTSTAFARSSFTPPVQAHQTASTPHTSLATLLLVTELKQLIQMVWIRNIRIHPQTRSPKSAAVARSMDNTPSPPMVDLLRINLSCSNTSTAPT
jgi:hypothetical protein